MTNATTGGRALAIGAGLLFTAGALGILLEDVILNDASLTLKHALTVLTVAGTIMSGHLASEAQRSRAWLSSAGFAALFVTGTALTVYNSVGRQAEHTMLAEAEVEAQATERADIKPRLARAEAMLAEAQADLARECKSGRGKRCEGIRATIEVYEASIRGHKADLERLGPAKIAVPEAKRAGELAAVFGLDAKSVEAGSILAVPFLTTMFLEIGSIVCFGFGFRRSRRAPVPAKKTVPVPPARKVEPGSDIVVDWVKAFRAKHGRNPRIDELQSRFPRVPKTTAWRRCKAA